MEEERHSNDVEDATMQRFVDFCSNLKTSNVTTVSSRKLPIEELNNETVQLLGATLLECPHVESLHLNYAFFLQEVTSRECLGPLLRFLEQSPSLKDFKIAMFSSERWAHTVLDAVGRNPSLHTLAYDCLNMRMSDFCTTLSLFRIVATTASVANLELRGLFTNDLLYLLLDSLASNKSESVQRFQLVNTEKMLQSDPEFNQLLNKVIRQKSNLRVLNLCTGKAVHPLLGDLDTFSSFLESLEENYALESLKIDRRVLVCLDETPEVKIRKPFKMNLSLERVVEEDDLAGQQERSLELQGPNFSILSAISKKMNRITELTLKLDPWSSVEQGRVLIHLHDSDVLKNLNRLEVNLGRRWVDNENQGMAVFHSELVPAIVNLIRHCQNVDKLIVNPADDKIFFPFPALQQILSTLINNTETPRVFRLFNVTIDQSDTCSRSLETQNFGIVPGHVDFVHQAMNGNWFNSLKLYSGAGSSVDSQNLFGVLINANCLEELVLHNCKESSIYEDELVQLGGFFSSLIRRNAHLKRLLIQSSNAMCNTQSIAQILSALVENETLEKLVLNIDFYDMVGDDYDFYDDAAVMALISVLPKLTSLKHLSFSTPLTCSDFEEEIIASLKHNQCLEHLDLQLRKNAVADSAVPEQIIQFQHRIDYFGHRNRYRVFWESEEEKIPLGLWGFVLNSTERTNGLASSLIFTLLRAKSNVLVQGPSRKRYRED